MFRAKIVEKIDQNFCHILFIDFGNEEIVHINDIYELSDELKVVSKNILFKLVIMKQSIKNVNIHNYNIFKLL